MNSVLIYISENSPRANYTFNVVLKSLLGLSFQTTSDTNEFKNYNGAKFSYCKNKLADEIHFESTNLLFEKNINNAFFENKTIEQAFKIENNSIFKIDIFAASFYLLSRYEEYNCSTFDYTKSILFRSNLLQQPVINQWAIELKMLLQSRFSALEFKINEYKIIPTFDIDRAFAFKARGIVTTIGGFIRDLIKFNFFELLLRIKVLLYREHDPFDAFDYIETANKNVGLQTIYFLHCGNYNGVDKNVDFSNPVFKNLISKISNANLVGIHPSLKSINNNSLLKTELTTLQNLVNTQKVNSSRQHYLQIKFPDSYQTLIEHQLIEDFTMGYSNHCGFRAGISNSFYWYNLSNESITPLLIHPFCIIESCYQYYHNNNSNAFLKDAELLSNNIKSVGGDFCFVWHNQSLSEIYEYKGWSKIYNHFLTAII